MLTIRSALVAAAGFAHAATAVTIYTSLPGSIPTQFLNNGTYTGLPAFDPVQQIPPPAPTPAVATNIVLALPTQPAGLNSKQHRTDFVGMSLEMAVSDTLLGRNGTFLNPVFLNHVQNLRARAGKVSIRVGGNSQEKMHLVDPSPLYNRTIMKTPDPNPSVGGFVNSPLLSISDDLIYAMNNISALVGVGWYFGLPFLNETAIPDVANTVSNILGTNLLGFQLANEPDLYQGHGKKPAPYQIPEYMADWERVRAAYVPGRTDLIAPNVCCSWTIDEVLAAGFLTQFAQHLQFVSVQHYKDNACPSNLAPITPQTAFNGYQTHVSATNFFLPYVNASNQINAAGKDFVLLETNTASCGGFAGASDSFAAAMYLIDLSLQAASIGIGQLLLHNGGVGQFYNLFTPPPSNQSSFRQWTTAPPYYSALIMSEVMAEAGSQVMDLVLNNNNTNTPGYGIYKNGIPVKVALFNYITDPSGANDVTVALSIGGGTTGQASSTPASVQVKYFSSATGSTADKFNLTWAGQTMGDQFSSDGRLQGTESMETIQCSNGVCNIPVKAPQFALVMLDGVDGVNPALATQTFATTVATRLVGAAMVPASVLATSNGRGGAQEAFNIGATSAGGFLNNAAERRAIVQSGLFAMALGVVAGVWVLVR